jgi:hypothetical protein
MRDCALSLLMGPTSSPLVLVIVGAPALIAAGTLAVYPLRHIAPEISLGVVFLPGVVMLSTAWGLGDVVMLSTVCGLGDERRWVQALLRAERGREGMGSALAR